MISTTAIKGEKKAHYYLKVLREEPSRYLQPAWFGRGAKKLDLEHIETESFLQVYRGFSPDGKIKLVRNAGAKDRNSGSDFCFAVEKSVSMLAMLADDKTREQIHIAILEAVKESLTVLESQAIARRGINSQEKDSADLAIALLPHWVSRSEDMHIHIHALVMNACVRSDGSTGAIDIRHLASFEMRLAIDALFQAELSKQLQNRIGVLTERQGNSFSVEGFTKSQVENFSKRRKAILKQSKQTGKGSYQERQHAAINSRHGKQDTPLDELMKRWKEEAASIGITSDVIHGLTCNWRKRDHAQDVADILEEAGREVIRHNATFDRKDVICAVARSAIGKRVGAAECLELTNTFLRQESIIRLGEHKGRVLYTTVEMLALERELMEKIVEASERVHPLPINLVAQILRQKEYESIRQEQKEALIAITARPGGVKVIYGMAGTGKTYMLSAANKVWNQAGYEVFGVALSGKAAEGLSEGAGIASRTIASFLFRPPQLTKKSVLVVDEAAMVGTSDLSKLVSLVHEAGAKLVLVGDNRQLQPIDPGGAFASIEAALGSSKLSEITRQRDPWMIHSVHQFANGEAKQALQEYVDRGQVTIAKNGYIAMRSLIRQWREDGGIYQPHNYLILTGTNRSVDILNREAQRARQKERLVKEEGLAILSGKACVGDRIVFRKNSAQYHVKNGTFGEVRSVNTATNEISVKVEGRHEVQVIKLAAEHSKETYKNTDIALGYAVTTYKAQGATTAQTYILTSPGMQDRELTYVQMSRHRESAKIFTSEKEAGEYLTKLAYAMSISREKQLAVTIQESIQQQGEQATTVEEFGYSLVLRP